VSLSYPLPFPATMHPLEQYLVDVRAIRASGSATAETSYYGPLERLFNDVGHKLRPQVRCVMQPQDSGSGRPDGSLATEARLWKHAGVPMAPDRGVVEAKPPSVGVPRASTSAQVSGYLGQYKLVLVTNFRDFLLVEDQDGTAVELERFTLAPSEAAFWIAADNHAATTKAVGDRFLDFLERVMLHNAPLDAPEQVARFLASYARDARSRLESAPPALAGLRTAIEESLGLEFREGQGEAFFRSTVVQTLFYGLFSAWVVWHRDKPGRKSDFDWKTASWSLHLPAVGTMFSQLAQPSGAGQLHLTDPLDWATHLLNRVNRDRFFKRFEEEHAVQYFYEPFLREFDPELRKQLGVWYTPPEVVKYMVARVDLALRDDLGIKDGFADPCVYVLDPCCGTGAYLVEVLRRIEQTLVENRGRDALIGADVRRAAIDRVFGFEIMPAPFVVAHLQLGLHLQQINAPLTDPERPAIYLTNALTGWEPDVSPPKSLLYPELEAERDAAEHVKRDTPILVVLGNPPYNGYAGVSVEEERGLTDAYRTTRRVAPPQGQGLNDLYVRFFRMAERRIAAKTGRGIVSFISNYSWLDGLSFTGMRERYLDQFDCIWIDSLNGDKYKTGKTTPDGKPDPSIFSTESNREGIQVGTAVTLLVRRGAPSGTSTVHFRSLWGTDKHRQLLDSAKNWSSNAYQPLQPALALGLPFLPASLARGYLSWPKLTELFPVSFPGVKTSRDQLLVDIDRGRLEARMKRYFDPKVSDEEIAREMPSAMAAQQRFDPRATRTQLLKEGFSPQRVVRYSYRPFDSRWLHWQPSTKLLDEKREDYVQNAKADNPFLFTTGRTRKSVIEPPIVDRQIVDLNCMDSGARGFPLWLLAADGRHQNLSNEALVVIGDLGCGGEALQGHCIAILQSERYREENHAGLRHGWPRMPIPSSVPVMRSSASLGMLLAELMNPLMPVQGVTSGAVRPELRVLGGLQSPQPDYAIAARWGIHGQGGVVMPGPGKANLRPYLPEELAALAQGAEALGMTTEEAFACLGEKTYDIYLNSTTYWKNVPEKVWRYTMGGYQVLKKWLSYREAALLGRPLRPDEAGHFRDVARRIAAILLMGPELDANYRACAADAIPWPPV